MGASEGLRLVHDAGGIRDQDNEAWDLLAKRQQHADAVVEESAIEALVHVAGGQEGSRRAVGAVIDGPAEQFEVGEGGRIERGREDGNTPLESRRIVETVDRRPRRMVQRFDTVSGRTVSHRLILARGHGFSG
jgi:hypothetical protein